MKLWLQVDLVMLQQLTKIAHQVHVINGNNTSVVSVDARIPIDTNKADIENRGTFSVNHQLQYEKNKQGLLKFSKLESEKLDQNTSTNECYE